MCACVCVFTVFCCGVFGAPAPSYTRTHTYTFLNVAWGRAGVLLSVLFSVCALVRTRPPPRALIPHTDARTHIHSYTHSLCLSMRV